MWFRNKLTSRKNISIPIIRATLLLHRRTEEAMGTQICTCKYGTVKSDIIISYKRMRLWLSVVFYVPVIRYALTRSSESLKVGMSDRRSQAKWRIANIPLLFLELTLIDGSLDTGCRRTLRGHRVHTRVFERQQLCTCAYKTMSYPYVCMHLYLNVHLYIRVHLYTRLYSIGNKRKWRRKSDQTLT